MQLQHKGAGKGKVQPLVSSWKQEPDFLIRENCEGFRSFGQDPEVTAPAEVCQVTAPAKTSGSGSQEPIGTRWQRGTGYLQ